MTYKIMFKKKGDKNWLTGKTDDTFSRTKYFKTKKAAQNYAKYLTRFQTKIVKTKKRK